MKKLMFLLVLFCMALTAKEIKTQGIKVKMKLVSDQGTSEVWSETDGKGLVTGVLFSGTINSPNDFIGSGNVMDLGYLEDISKADMDRITNPTGKSIASTDLSVRNVFTNGNWFVHYTIYPKYIPTIDSLKVYYKYLLYEKKKAINEERNNYDISLHEGYFMTPANIITSPDFLKELFPAAKEIAVSFEINNINKGEIEPHFYLDDYKLKPEDIKESAKRISTGEPAYYIAADFFRFSKNGDSLLAKRSIKFPSEIYRIYPDNNSAQGYPYKNSKGFLLDIWKGYFSLPFENYNPAKKQLFAESIEYKNSQIKYSLKAIPLAIERDKYSFNVIISQDIWGGLLVYSKKITLEPGKALRIDVETGGNLSRTEELKGGKQLVLRLDEDYQKYVNEYIILTLEKN